MPTPFQEIHRVRHRAPPRFLNRSQRNLLLFFLKCVIMVVVTSLFLFFLGFAAIVLLHFLFMSNTFSRRCARLFNPVNTASADSTAEQEQEQDPVPESDKLYIETLLPGVAYSTANFPDKSDCAICLDSFRDGDSCRKIPVCGHLFHAECVDRWIGRKPTCPVCRTRINLDPPRSPGISGGDDRWKRLWTVHFEEGTSY